MLLNDNAPACMSSDGASTRPAAPHAVATAFATALATATMHSAQVPG